MDRIEGEVDRELCQLRIKVFKKYVTLEILENGLYRVVFSIFFDISCIIMQ